MIFKCDTQKTPPQKNYKYKPKYVPRLGPQSTHNICPQKNLVEICFVFSKLDHLACKPNKI